MSGIYGGIQAVFKETGQLATQNWAIREAIPTGIAQLVGRSR